MANKMYEESSIQDIANAIREKNGNADTYKVSQMGDAIRDIPTKVYHGEVVSTVSGGGKYVVLAKDDWLAEHRTDETLFVRAEFVHERVAYTVAKSWAQNTVHLFLYNTTTAHQAFLRYNQNVLESYNYIEHKIHDNTTLTSGVGRLHITEDGELRCYANSSNYAIRPGKYVVKIEWS